MFDQLVWHLRKWGLLVVGAILSIAYLTHWQQAFTADRALIGVFGSAVVGKGQSLLFLFNVAYEGMLLEGALVAASLRLLGQTPLALFLPNWLLFLFTAWVFYRFLRRFGPPGVAEIATLFLFTVSPAFLNFVARPQPNLTTTFLLGIVQFWAALEAQEKGRRAAYFVFGLAAGFGFYTYALSLTFTFTALLNWFLVRSNPGPSRALFWAFPSLATQTRMLQRRISLSFSWMALGFFCVSFFLPDHFRGLIPVVGCLGITHAVCAPWSRKNALLWGLFGVGLLVGVSPKVIGYFLHDGLYSTRATVGGTWALFPHRIQVLLDCMSGLGIPLLWLGGATGCVLLRRNASVRLFGLLGLVTALGFAFSNNALDATSIRYVFALSAVAMVGFAAWLCRPQANTLRLNVAFTLLLFFIGLGQTWSHLSGSSSSEATRPYRLIDYLDSKKITEGYSDYWFAYPVNYLTRDRIALEPVRDPYSPHYAARVAAASRIAVLEPIGRPIPLPESFGPAALESESVVSDVVVKIYTKTARNQSEQ